MTRRAIAAAIAGAAGVALLVEHLRAVNVELEHARDADLDLERGTLAAFGQIDELERRLEDLELMAATGVRIEPDVREAARRRISDHLAKFSLGDARVAQGLARRARVTPEASR